MRFSFLNNELKSMRYYGSGDLAGGVFVKDVADSLESIENNLDELNSDIVETEDLYRYLWLLSFKEMADEIDKYKVDESIKDRIKTLSKSLDYSPSRFINFINGNYMDAFDKSKVGERRWYAYFDSLMGLIFGHYSKSIHDEVFDYIEEKFTIDILADFDRYACYYKKHQERIKTLFKDLDSTRVLDDLIYCKFLMNSNIKDDGFLAEQAKFICERAIKHIKGMKLTSDTEEILQIDNRFANYRKIAIMYHLLCANEYNEYKKKIDDLREEYVKKHSQSIDYGSINLKPVLDLFKKSKDTARFLQLTHTLNNGEFKNNFDLVPYKTEPDSLFDFFERIGQPRSEKYPYYKQDEMKSYTSLYCQILACIFNDSELESDFAKYVFNISKQVENNVFHESILFCDEMIGALDLIANCFGLLKNKDDRSPLYKALVNGCAMNEVGLLEKILRNVAHIDDKGTTYFDQDSNTMGVLFKRHHFEKLSSGLMYYLEFYLSLESSDKIKKDKRPGKNIRNVQMHNHNDKYGKTNLELCLLLFYFLLSLLGDLFLGAELKK